MGVVRPWFSSCRDFVPLTLLIAGACAGDLKSDSVSPASDGAGAETGQGGAGLASGGNGEVPAGIGGSNERPGDEPRPPDGQPVAIDEGESTLAINTFTNWKLRALRASNDMTLTLSIDGEVYGERLPGALHFRRSDHPRDGRLSVGTHTFEVRATRAGEEVGRDSVEIEVVPFTNHESHPFLLLNARTDMEEMRTRRENVPFSYMANVSTRCENEVSVIDDYRKFSGLAQHLSYCMLRYMLETDAETRAAAVAKTAEAVRRWPQGQEHIGSPHAAHVDAATALLNTTLALDLMHDAFSVEVLNELEAITDAAMTRLRYFRGTVFSTGGEQPVIQHPMAMMGALVVWAMYTGDDDLFDTFYYGDSEVFDLRINRRNGDPWNIDGYESQISGYFQYFHDSYVFDDGSWAQSPGYVQARMGGGRTGKSHALDVVTFNEIDDWYADRAYRGTVQWTLSMAYTPFGSFTTFGDQLKAYGDSEQGIFNTMLYKSHHIDPELARQAMWLMAVPTGNSDAVTGPRSFDHTNFLTYVLGRDFSLSPKPVVSSAWPMSGAALWGRGTSREVLHGVLHSLGEQGGHDHEDTNTLHLTGYGEHLLINAGTNYDPGYPGQTPDGDPWHPASLQNAVLIGSQNAHTRRYGAGLTHSLLGGEIEFARTDAGEALGNGSHFRSLVMVHEEPGRANGYFVIVDEVQPDNPSDPVRVILQTNSRQGSVSGSERAYSALVDGFVQDAEDSPVGLDLFFAGPLTSSSIGSSWRGSSTLDFRNNYVEGVFQAGDDGWSRSATIAFPADGTHRAAILSLREGTGWSGVTADHGGGVVDTVLLSSGDVALSDDDTEWQGLAVLFRAQSDEVERYFVELGQSLRKGASGFTSSRPISISMARDRGVVFTTEETEVCLFAAEVAAISVDGDEAQLTDAGTEFGCVMLSPGEHRLELIQ